ncbi:hypothetical protein CRG98_046935 [Punica granatum]|uniref:tRNA synthetases class I catalytic domain-containing protein n=1 Tax=Punica granatum TaxID=22663 RepID=A0A2I0HMH0_PUNGR|nr:hypothetical protein CRG98_046935 [Punica granatum]
MEKKNKLAVELREQLRLYNSMTQQKEVLKPLVEGKVGMYVCGITTYDFSHLGYARPPSLSTSSIGTFYTWNMKLVRSAASPISITRSSMCQSWVVRVIVCCNNVRCVIFSRAPQPEKPGEPIRWESPRGPGRPGWHIECSAMSNHHLSHKFDIHGGESDLSFPHHENEIAQSCAACPEARINYWMHKGLVSILKDREDALLSFKQEIESTEQPNDEAQECTSEVWREFYDKMSDDLNISHIEAQVKGILGILGFLVLSVLPLTYERVLEELKKKALRRAELEQADLEKLIRKRALARKNKEFTKSDQIRASLMAKGIELMELGDETDWRPCPPLPPANQAAKSPSENVCSVAVHVQQQPLILP